MVSISGCDPLDPGSNPGTAILFLVFVWRGRKKKQVLPGLEPGLQGSEPWVLTNYTIEPFHGRVRTCSGGVVGYHACLTRTRSRVRSSSRVLFFCLDQKLHTPKK